MHNVNRSLHFYQVLKALLANVQERQKEVASKERMQCNTIYTEQKEEKEEKVGKKEQKKREKIKKGKK